jgi:tripartite-type tricarboxylate transporter receptor subunit TctC
MMKAIADWRLPVLALLLFATASASAQTWPAKPVRVIVSFAAGSGPDIITRVVIDPLSRAWGQPVIVDNRPGSGNVVGAQAAARAPADGYTYYFATAAALATNPLTFKSLPYDPVRDFAPVAMIGKARFFVLANPAVPVKSLPELIALDKAAPGKLAFASDGPRNFPG